MTPDSVHLLAQTIRHHRAMATSFEKWVFKQEPSQTTRELVQMLAAYRDVLTRVESEISRFEVDTDQVEA